MHLAFCQFGSLFAAVVGAGRGARFPSVAYQQPKVDVASTEACVDDYPKCASLGAQLWGPDGSCRYPIAEACSRTCGDCPRIVAARSCQCWVDSCAAPFRNQFVDWEGFFAKMVAQQDFKGRILATKPWLAEFPNFLSDYEADHLVNVAERSGFLAEDTLPERVRNVSKVDCDEHICTFDPVMGEIYRRMSELLDIPGQNFESFEFLHYTPGQHYQPHMDAEEFSPRASIASELDRNVELLLSGQRVLTVIMYLSNVDEGGKTGFPEISLTVPPQKGKMLIWTNVQADYWRALRGSLHEAEVVERGVKIVATFWIHPFDFRVPERYADRDMC